MTDQHMKNIKQSLEFLSHRALVRADKFFLIVDYDFKKSVTEEMFCARKKFIILPQNSLHC